MAQNQAPLVPQGETDPSMDDILASIRRILSDEEKAAKAQAPSDGVLKLDPSMMIDDETAAETMHEGPHEGEMHDIPVIPVIPVHSEPVPEPRFEQESDAELAPSRPAAVAGLAAPMAEAAGSVANEGLIAPEAAAMAASSVGTLMRTLMSERHAVVHRGGPTIEDLVREEIRPLLKGWLDRHLPDMVERLVRAEIERVVSRISH